jgi:type VI protein secretion system component Hcp
MRHSPTVCKRSVSVAIYMIFGDISGSVTTDGFKDWIHVDSFQWGVGRGVTSPHGSEDTREGSEPSVSEVVVTKRMEKASPKLWQDAVGGDFSAKVTIKFTSTTKDKVESYLECAAGESVTQLREGELEVQRAGCEDQRQAGNCRLGSDPAEENMRRPYRSQVTRMNQLGKAQKGSSMAPFRALEPRPHRGVRLGVGRLPLVRPQKLRLLIGDVFAGHGGVCSGQLRTSPFRHSSRSRRRIPHPGTASTRGPAILFVATRPSKTWGW